MPRHPAEDGSLWGEPEPSAGRRRLTTLMIAVAATIAMIVVILQIKAYIDPQMTTTHG